MNTTEPSIWFCYVGTKLNLAGWSWLRKELQDSGKMPIDKISLLNEDFIFSLLGILTQSSVKSSNEEKRKVSNFDLENVF